MRVVSSSPVVVIEGDWVPSGIVVMEFPTMTQAMAWKDDPDYVAPSKIRHATARTNMIFVDDI